MTKVRLEAFSDGVLAIIITIMVLEIKIPHTSEWNVFIPLLPVLFSYLLSFMFVGIYWANHHHLLHAVKKISSPLIWANMNLLFWLSLTPFATGWMGENHFETNTVIVYACLLLMDGIAYTILKRVIEKSHDKESEIFKALRTQKYKEYISIISYALAIVFAFISTKVSGILFLLVAILWIIPARKIEQALSE